MFGTKDRLKAFGDLWWAKAKELGFRADKYTAEGEGHGFFNRSPWMEHTTIAADKFLASLGYLDGEPTMKVPTGEKLKALKAEKEKKSAAGKLTRIKKNQALKAEQDKKAKERGKQ